MDDVINYTPFSTRLLPAPVGAGFAMDDWWVWCGSVVRGTDGYVMYAARWPRDLAPLTHRWRGSAQISHPGAENATVS